MLSIILSNSGKCSPYHSLSLELRAFAILSISSNELMACMICKSGLSETSVTFDDDSPNANSLSFPKASCGLDAKPESTIILGFIDCISSISSDSII